MSSIIHNILTTTIKFATEFYDFFEVEYFEPVNMFDAYIVLASIV